MDKYIIHIYLLSDDDTNLFRSISESNSETIHFCMTSKFSCRYLYSQISNQNKPKAKTIRFTFLEYFPINVTNNDRSYFAKRIEDRVSHVKPQFEEEKSRSNASIYL